MGDFFENLVYSEDDILKFPLGVPGFEQCKKYVLVSLPEYAPFEWLVCVSGTRLRFAVINPLLFNSEYSPDIKKVQLEDLEIKKAEDILMYVIVTIHENPLQSTANLTGPIIINRSKRLGKQIIVDDDRYSTQEPLLRKK